MFVTYLSIGNQKITNSSIRNAVLSFRTSKESCVMHNRLTIEICLYNYFILAYKAIIIICIHIVEPKRYPLRFDRDIARACHPLIICHTSTYKRGNSIIFFMKFAMQSVTPTRTK